MPKYTIALDAGHGLKTAGKQTLKGSKGIIKEWTLNDKVRDYVVDYLEDYDVGFVFPDNDEGKVDEELVDRFNRYMKLNVALVISLHHNAFKNKWGKHTGVEVWTDKGPTAKDTKLAKAIYKNLPKYTGLVGRGIKAENFLIINQDRIPGVLVEGGFMDSLIDYDVITSKEGQKGYAKAVAEGIIEFLDLEKKTTDKTFFTKKGYYSQGDVHTNIGKVAKFMYNTFPAYTPKAALGNYYGPNIKKAIKEFQKRTGLETDGCLGPLTLAELIKYGFTYK